MKKLLVFSLMFGLFSPLLLSAQTDQIDNTAVSSSSSVAIVYDGACASGAVIEHENAQQTIVEARQASMKTAVLARRDALGAAYLLTDRTARDTAIKSAHGAFIAAQKTADKTAMEASKIEHKSFIVKMKECGAVLPPQTRDQINNQNGFDNTNQTNSNNGNGVKVGLVQRVLKQGVRGEDVKNIQKILGLKTDGVFGPGTAAKVKEWQARRGLKQDGIIGKESLAKIEIETSDVNVENQTNASDAGSN